MKHKIFVINLDERADKFKNVETLLIAQGLTCERIPAIRGSNLSEEQISNTYDASANKKHYMKTMSAGEIGCYLSHRKAWQKIVDEKLDYAIILEDDAEPTQLFSKGSEILKQIKNWDFIKLQGGRGGRKIIDSIMTQDPSIKIARYDSTPVSCLAQAISNQGALKLLASSQPFFRPVDVDIQHYWERGIDVIGLEPRIINKANFDSDIAAASQNQGRGKKSKLLPRLKYRLLLAINKQRHNPQRPNPNKYLE